ncbi:MAG: hypothetical protein ACXADL_10020 [Candidatus Thorarchaeota archaeon]
MQRRTKIAAIILIITISLPVLWLLSTGDIVATELEWSVQIGDEFQYRIEYYYENETHGDYTEEVKLWLMPLNNSLIVFEVSNLPSIPILMNADGFVSAIIEQDKCEVRFANGSEVSEVYSNVLTFLFSRCLLPTGDWNYLDGLFTDRSNIETLYELVYNYHSYIADDTFCVDHIGRSHHDYKGWSGSVNMTTGIPIAIRQFSYSTMAWAGFRYDLLLNLE